MKESNQICPNLRPFVIPDTNAAWLANIFKETEIFAYISIGHGDCFHMVCEKYSGSFVHNVFEVLTQKDIDIKKKKIECGGRTTGILLLRPIQPLD